jgi:hypothetical protein
MSNAPTPSSPAPVPPPPPPPAPAARVPNEIIIYGHTTLFYWWPVWFFGFLFGLITYTSGDRIAIVPSASEYVKSEKVIKVSGDLPERALAIGENGRFGVHISSHPTLGVLYVFIIIVCIMITSVPLRGVSSLVAIVVIALIIVSISALGWWEHIFFWFGNLRVFNNMGFYVLTSTVLFILWAFVFFVFDRMNYWRVTPGQITHKYVFGGGERSFDTAALAFEKKRDDLFRHMVLGFGSGDLVMDPMKAGGAAKEDLQIYNVLFISSKLRQMDELVAKQTQSTMH